MSYEDDEDGEEEEWDDGEQGTEHTVHLRVHYATHIPRVDLMSESDPYVVLRLPQESPGTRKAPPRTRTIQDDPNPVWEEDFFFECLCFPDGRLQGEVEMEVWDEDMTCDSIIGKTTLDLARYDPYDYSGIELPLVLVDKVKAWYEKQLQKQQKRGILSIGKKAPPPEAPPPPSVVVSIVGSTPSFASLCDTVERVPGAVIDAKARLVLCPIAGYPVLAGSQFSSDPRKGPCHWLVSTQQHGGGTGLRLDFGLPAKGLSVPSPGAPQGAAGDEDGVAGRNGGGASGSGSGSTSGGGVVATLERWHHPRGRKITPELRVYDEVCLAGLPLCVDLEQVTTTVAPKGPTVAAYDIGALLNGAQWQGPGMSFKQALASMRDYIADSSTKDQEIFVTTDGELPPSCVLALNFSQMEPTQLGPSPAIVAYPNRDSGLEWEMGADELATHVREHVYGRSIKVMRGEGRFRAKRKLQLVDNNGQLSCDEEMCGLQLLGFELEPTDIASWPLQRAVQGEFAVAKAKKQRGGNSRGLGDGGIGSIKEKLFSVPSKFGQSLKGMGKSLSGAFGSVLRIGRSSEEASEGNGGGGGAAGGGTVGSRGGGGQGSRAESAWSDSLRKSKSAQQQGGQGQRSSTPVGGGGRAGRSSSEDAGGSRYQGYSSSEARPASGSGGYRSSTGRQYR